LTAVYSVLVSWIARKCNNEINFPITTPSYTHMRAASRNTTMAVDGAKDRRDMLAMTAAVSPLTGEGSRFSTVDRFQTVSRF
jgi:hypothetical protein